MEFEDVLWGLDPLELPLKPSHKDVLRLVWQGLAYPAIAEQLGYSPEYVRKLGADLWRLLSQVLGEPVEQKNVRQVLQRWLREHLPCREAANPVLQDWGDAIAPDYVWGRSQELAQLQTWMAEARVITLVGMGGMGKTTLAIAAAQQINPAALVWRSLQASPPLEQLLHSLLVGLRINPPVSGGVEQFQQLLQQTLRDRRCLVILDNFESILQQGGRYRAGYEDYGPWLRQLACLHHDSCVLITGREQPRDLEILADAQVRSLALKGLFDPEAVKYLFSQRGVFLGTPQEWQQLAQQYAGNPLALKIAAAVIQSSFDGNLEQFLSFCDQGGFVFADIRDLLDSQFQHLSPAEQAVLYWLTIYQEPVPIERLKQDVLPYGQRLKLLETLPALTRRSLIERHAQGFILQPVVREYGRELLVAEFVQAICDRQLAVLNTYGLVQAQAQDFVRASQRRLLLGAIAAQLQDRFQTLPALVQHLQQLLVQLQAEYAQTPGYAAGNLLNLLRWLGVDLRGWDFSGLVLWQADLQGLTLHEVACVGSQFAHCRFTQTFGSIWAVAFSPDGLLAASDSNNAIHLWEVATRRQHLSCQGHENWISAIAFDPQRPVLASGSADHTIKLWHTRSGECLQTLRGHENWILATAFSPDGTWLATGSADQTIRLWDPVTGVCHQILGDHGDWVRAVAFCERVQPLLGGSHEPLIQPQRSPQQQPAMQPQPQHDSPPPTRQTYLISGSADDRLRFWQWLPPEVSAADLEADLAAGSGADAASHWQLVQSIPAGLGGVWAIALTPDGQTLAAGGAEQIKLWDLATGRCLYTLRGHQGHVRSLAFSPDGQTLVSGSVDRSVRLWDWPQAQCRKILTDHTSDVWAVAWSLQGMIASGSFDKTVRLWHGGVQGSSPGTGLGDNLDTFQGYSDVACALAVTPDGQLISGGTDLTVKLWSQSPEQPTHPQRSLTGHTSMVLSVAMHPTQPMLASSSLDQTIRLWQLGSGKCLKVLQGHSNWVMAIAFDPLGRWLASGSFDHTVKLWNAQTGELLQTLQGHEGRIWDVNFHPQGSLLASCGEEGQICLWNLSGALAGKLLGHEGRIWAVRFSPDGSRLASAGEDATVRLWDPLTGQCLQVLTGHQGRVQAIAWHPDGRQLASGSQDCTIRIWQALSGDRNQHPKDCTPGDRPGTHGRNPYETQQILTGHSGWIWALVWSDTGLVSSSEDETLRRWDVTTATCTQILQGKRPYQGLDITQAMGLSEAQVASLKLLGAIER